MTRLAHTALLGTVLLQTPMLAQDFGDEWLVIGPVGRGGRSAVHTDGIEARIVRGSWKSPAAGEELALPGGRKREWKPVRREKGTVSVPRGGYAWTRLGSKEPQVVLLTAKGHSMVYVNGTPRAGNPYRAGWYQLPIRLRKGDNEFLFRCGRGAIQPGLMPVRKPVFFGGKDHTLPDLITAEATDTWLGVVVVNAGTTTLDGVLLRCRGKAVNPELPPLEVPSLPALSVYKCCVPLRGPAPEEAGESKLTLCLLRQDSPAILDELTLSLRVRSRSERHSRTYRSRVDGSAQYYAVNPPGAAEQRDSALFLSLHGAGVEARAQARAYSPKSWGHLVAPTNRRPFGFDWEDWGRRDAMDVLDEALARYPIDPSRVYLTGHSMGGHGTWHVGATFPGRFAAIGPSAGWISFWSYSSGRSYQDPDAVEDILMRAASQSDTLALRQNHARHGIYVLHGEQDRNVPVREARRMKQELEKFHQDFRYHEQPGAAHWWDGDDEPGAACVDWPPMFDFFARHRLPREGEVREVDFTTMNPSISAWCRFACIAAQERQLA
ncbi:MAG: prolyl oligopeptidase family serine peptidase, partial [Planctomycetota bacterium]